MGAFSGQRAPPSHKRCQKGQGCIITARREGGHARHNICKHLHQQHLHQQQPGGTRAPRLPPTGHPPHGAEECMRARVQCCAQSGSAWVRSAGSGRSPRTRGVRKFRAEIITAQAMCMHSGRNGGPSEMPRAAALATRRHSLMLRGSRTHWLLCSMLSCSVASCGTPSAVGVQLASAQLAQPSRHSPAGTAQQAQPSRHSPAGAATHQRGQPGSRCRCGPRPAPAPGSSRCGCAAPCAGAAWPRTHHTTSGRVRQQLTHPCASLQPPPPRPCTVAAAHVQRRSTAGCSCLSPFHVHPYLHPRICTQDLHPMICTPRSAPHDLHPKICTSGSAPLDLHPWTSTPGPAPGPCT